MFRQTSSEYPFHCNVVPTDTVPPGEALLETQKKSLHSLPSFERMTPLDDE